MKVKFEVLGVPRSKQRPRVCNFRGRKFSYTPKTTKDYENLIKSSYLAVSQKFWSKNLPVKMDIIAFFPIPKQLKKLLPTSSPDLDNVAKSVCDALNGVAYFDDSQICKLSIHKYYAKVPKIIVILGDLGDNLN